MMAERWIVEYVVNCAWQIPLLAAGAWLMAKLMRPGVLAQHWLWLSVLALAVMLPGHGNDAGKTPNKAYEPMSSSERSHLVGTPSLGTFSPTHVAFHKIWEGNELHRANDWTLNPLRKFSLCLSARVTRWLMCIYSATMLFGAARLLRAWFATRRLVRESREAVLDSGTTRMVEAAARRLGVNPPRLRESSGIAGPVVAGAMHPVLLLPESFARHPQEEIWAAISHELAHVRRRDYLVNLICQVVALPVAWHPATRAVQQRIRKTREMVCDAMAAEEMESVAEYARCLVTLARQMVRESAETQAMGLFESNTMEERVMKLSEAKAVTSRRARALRGLCGCAAMLAVAGSVTMFHVKPTFAATVMVADVQSAVAAPVEAAPTVVVPAPAQNAMSAVAPAARAQTEGNSGLSSPPDIEEDGPTATAGKGDYVHRWVGADGKKYVVVNRDPKEPSAEERLKEEQKLDDSMRGVDRAQFKLNESLGMLDKQLDTLDRLENDPKMKREMEELERRINSPVWQKQIAEAENKAQRILESPEWNKQLADLQKSLAELDVQQVAMEKSMIDVEKINVQTNMQMKEEMAKARKELESDELKAKLDAAQKMLDEAKKQMQGMEKK